MKDWFNFSVEETVMTLETDIEKGLTDEEVKARQEKYGYNELKAQKKKGIIIKFLEQFRDFMIIILMISAVISGIVGIIDGEGIKDTIIIMIVVIVNAIIGVIQENRAEKSLEALQKLSSHVAKVIRDGKLKVLPSNNLVPGDVIILETGDYVPADLRIIEEINLKAQESSLTGESVPVDKDAKKIDNQKVALGDRFNMLFSSSLITYGRGKAIVVETGMNTEVGKIAEIINNTVATETPLQKKVNKLGKTLGILALIICASIFIIGLYYGKEPLHIFMTSVSLAVAAIPEGLPAVFTIVLAIGVQRMVKRNAIVKKLPAVETLGSATVICSDKTGTLTQNKMTVEKLFYNGTIYNLDSIDLSQEDENLKQLVYAAMLCNDSKINEDNTLTGDPTETALISLGFHLNYSAKIHDDFPRVNEIPFDSNRKLMTTVHEVDNKFIVYTKGGVDEVLSKCTSYLYEGQKENSLKIYEEQIRENNSSMASNALRVLAMAYKVLDVRPEEKDLESELTYIGMVGMIDPPRVEVKEAVAKCTAAGIKTVMITGDHKITAMAIAKHLGILTDEKEALTGIQLEEMSDEDLIKNVKEYSVYARVSPEHKVRIVKAWQANGEIVAMTGDGVNDAPSLKTADIGCAMGIVGTDVAKEAADVILTDDNFATIVSAVEEGRRIYDNMLKAIQFLLSTNIGEVVAIFLAILLIPLIGRAFNIDIVLIEVLLPIHILWINLVTDSLPALALAVDPPAKDIMGKRPKKESIFTKGAVWRISYTGIMIGILTLIAFVIGVGTKNPQIINGLSEEEVKIRIGQTMAFLVLAFTQLTNVFNVRDNKNSIFKTGIFNNTKLILAILVSTFLMLILLFIPSLRETFNLVLIPPEHIFTVIFLILCPLIFVELFKFLKLNGSDNK